MDGGESTTELHLPTTREFMSAPSDDPMSPGGGTVHEFSFSARHLSSSEVVTDLLHEHGAHILVHCALIRSRDRITLETLRDALQRLADFQPALWMKVDSDKPNPLRRRVTKRFTEMPDDDRVVDVTIIPTNEAVSWQQVAQAELGRKFDSGKGPLWRVIYVAMGDCMEEGDAAEKTGTAKARPRRKSSAACHEGMLLFKIHHVIADGVSMLDLLLRQLVPMLNSCLKHDSDHAVPQFISSLPMAPPADESFIKKEQLSWTKRRSLRSASMRASQRSDGKVATEAPSSEPLLRVDDENKRTALSETGVLTLTFSSAVGSRFIERCTRSGVGFEEAMLTAASTALAVTAAFCQVDLHSDVVVCGRPVDLRRYHTLHTHYEPLGHWIACDVVRVSVPHRPPTDHRFWTDARTVATSIGNNERPWKSLCMYSEVAKALVNSTDVIKHKMFRVHLEVVSLIEDGDRTTAETHGGPATMQEHYFVKSMSDVTPATMALTSTLLRGRITCLVAFNSRWVSREFATKFADTLRWLIPHVTDPNAARMSQLVKLPAYVRACLIRSTDV